MALLVEFYLKIKGLRCLSHGLHAPFQELLGDVTVSGKQPLSTMIRMMYNDKMIPQSHTDYFHPAM